MAKRMRPEVYLGLLALLFVAVGVALLFAAGRFALTWYHLLACWLVSINLVTFAFYGHDKVQARGERGRVPEVVLHGLVFLGGTLGACLGMRLFRHKTIKAGFRLVFWMIAVMQALLVVAVAYRLWRHHQG
jgi:uncharacterized membrane protein YsdA (DUF1294 family)